MKTEYLYAIGGIIVGYAIAHFYHSSKATPKVEVKEVAPKATTEATKK